MTLQPRSLCIAIADKVRLRILAHEWTPGAPINDADIARDYGVSRTPVREAFKLLCQDGLLQSHPRRGMSVAEPDSAQLREAQALQQWLHNFDAFESMSETEQDHSVGRRRSDNEELDDAPESAHVKRTAQESFTPEAFVLRRSMPWALHTPSGDKAGLMFAAFGSSFYAFETQMRRMLGQEDGIVDAMFRFSQPVTGAYLWCPPMHAGRLDLRALAATDMPT